MTMTIKMAVTVMVEAMMVGVMVMTKMGTITIFMMLMTMA